MRVNQFAFAFGIFALVVGVIVDIYGLVTQFGSMDSSQVVLIGSIILAIGLAFLSLPNRLERYCGQLVVGLGLLYYFYIQTNKIWVAVIIALIAMALMEYGLKHR
ncbi:hypothetical protein FC51_GL000617 [Lentilactobacillus parabuchneri DSM 5707 = NBRC 107865]|uniref:Integral membrane protein n=1 Tax=Lentilactobacillus parabuchneri DSM 5707 = NBRC 107865 TaxID=1423784 RepID=A0A0R1Z2F7_9LACO|nr:hypothetical protein [Lentilactobacillus parabuchneri]KRM46038.1 hypothetical protein FC51_GL000617 [Lentilactobacillus parabuchneri DSM 5707 = NBRC 107865]MDG9737376.1 hypothetical protein [Lentilactobacillus parabuchneri]